MAEAGIDVTGPTGSRLAGVSGALLTTSLVMVATVAALGPSAAEPVLPGAVPLHARVHPAPALVTALLALAVLTGAGGTATALRALARGWSPGPRRLLIASGLTCMVFAVLPPIASADPLSYASYGRAAALGADPYAVTPAQLAARGDPVARLVQPPWRTTASVYGPVATAEQEAVLSVTGARPGLAVLVLDVVNALAFLLTALLLVRMAPTVRARQRAVLLWAVNPLLLFTLVAGAHLDALMVCAVVGALAVLRRAPAAAGALLGAAVAVKPTAALAAAGCVLLLLRSRRRLAGLVAGMLVVLLPSYLLAGPHVLDQERRAGRFVSHATFWRPLAVRLDSWLGAGASRSIIGAAAVLLAAGVALAVYRRLAGPEAAARATRPAAGAARRGLPPVLGWLLAAPYQLPWYDALGWGLVPVAEPEQGSRLPALLLVHTAALSLAYLPGLDVALPHGLAVLTRTVRTAVVPVVLAGTLVAVVLWAVRIGRDSATTQ